MLPLTIALGLLLFVAALGGSGLVDETPPLFAAAGRAMAETGDWLTPRVNGLPRYDKPPLVYWLMASGYALPARAFWDPLGTWAARLPSALSTVLLMAVIAAVLQRWPQGRARHPARTALAAALAFALSPLVLLWGRIAVSDALLSSMLGVSLLLFWQSYVESGRRFWLPWLVLGLAVLTKGPVALVLAGMTLLAFGLVQRDLPTLWRQLRPWRGLLITALVALPWYVAELAVEGQPFWDSFFGYHNFQRLTQVVNDHRQPWWFFLPVAVIASLPFTPLLVHGLITSLKPLWAPALRSPPRRSLGTFAACWLLAVFVLFTAAATKLPSYWLPATPAAGLLIALSAQDLGTGRLKPALATAWLASFGLLLALSGVLWASPRWVPLIQDPEMPQLPAELMASGYVLRAAVCFSVASALALALALRPRSGGLLAVQGALVAFQVTALMPMWLLGDRVRQLPVRVMATEVERHIRPGEPLAMVGIMKPSLHFYSRRPVTFEGRSAGALANLSDRLHRERRRGLEPSSPEEQPTVLMVIDAGTADQQHWRDLGAEPLASEGLYRLWRLPRTALDERAADLLGSGAVTLTWNLPKDERY
ncbi:glycosyltransferase family 39 protein [Synechococcus sp. RSCCF101]|nr:glycosyltransferase family 39 protein [Synechococcus sp. RSCCF101]